jgi:hypothetical protein
MLSLPYQLTVHDSDQEGHMAKDKDKKGKKDKKDKKEKKNKDK